MCYDECVREAGSASGKVIESMYPGTIEPQTQYRPGSWGGGASEQEAQNQFLRQVLQNFGFSLLLAAGGAYAVWSMNLAPQMYLPLTLVEFGLILAMTVFRRRATVNPLLVYIFAIVSGATTVPIMQWAVHTTHGTSVIYNALGATGAIFFAMAWYGNSSQRNLAGWSTFLFMGLFGALIASFIGIFLTHSPLFNVMLSAVVVVVMTGLVAYDINQIKLNWRAYDVNVATLNLYLDFLNLFVNILRIMAILSGGGGGGRRD